MFQTGRGRKLDMVIRVNEEWKWTLFSVALMLVTSLSVGLLVYRVGLLF